MKRVEISELMSDPAQVLELAAHEDIVLTQDGQPKFQLLTCDEDEEWEQQLAEDPRFIAKIERSRQQFREGKFVSLEEINKRVSK